MNYSVVHAACKKELFTLPMPKPFGSVEEVVEYAVRQLAADFKKVGEYERGWPLECDECGGDLQFMSDAGGARRPVLRLEGSTIFHS